MKLLEVNSTKYESLIIEMTSEMPLIRRMDQTSPSFDDKNYIQFHRDKLTKLVLIEPTKVLIEENINFDKVKQYMYTQQRKVTNIHQSQRESKKSNEILLLDVKYGLRDHYQCKTIIRLFSYILNSLEAIHIST